jgi:hypothetical protein
MALRAWIRVAAAAALVGGWPAPSWSLLIDDFEVSQTVSGPQPSGYPVLGTVTGDMLGGARTMNVGGMEGAYAVTGAIGGGLLTVTQTAEGQRFVDLGWQVDDPIDLTEGGTIRAFRLELESFSGLGVAIVHVSSDPFGHETSQLLLPFDGAGLLDFELDAFHPKPGTSGGDLTSALLVSLRIHTWGDATLSGGLRTVPEPSLVLTLLGVGAVSLAARARRSARG